MKILGTNFFGHDSSVFYLDTDKKKIFALSTERLTRIKHDNHDISILFKDIDNDIKNVEFVAQGYEDYSWVSKPYYYHSLKHFRKIIKPEFLSDLLYLKKDIKYKKFLISFFKNPAAFFGYLYYKILTSIYKVKKKFVNRSKFIEKTLKKFIKNSLKEVGIDKPVQYHNHHKCHAASAYYFSEFAYDKEALSLTIDGYGDHLFSSLYKCSDDNLELIGESIAETMLFGKKENYASVGFLYSTFTAALGFIPFSEEGKVEALAAFGKIDKNLYIELEDLVSFKSNSMHLDKEKVRKFYDQDYLRNIINKIGREDFASCIQVWLENIIVNYLNYISKANKCENLCLSGGVAANVIMNMNIFEKTNFKNIYIFPAMGDEGVAAGAAFLSAVENKQDISWIKKVTMPYFGTEIIEKDILEACKKFNNIKFKKIENDIHKYAAESLSKNKVIALVQGKMEFGPRALGNRSILASPYNKETKDRINSEIKKRPAFQPFCPSILEEDREKYFLNSYNNKHMTIAFVMKKEFAEKFPSAVHIDGTARPQFVTKKGNTRFYNILNEFKTLTGHGILINTSFNLHGRSMVNSPYDAIRDFIDCNLDELYIGDFLVIKTNS